MDRFRGAVLLAPKARDVRLVPLGFSPRAVTPQIQINRDTIATVTLVKGHK